MSPTSARRVELPAEQKTDNDIGKRFALGSDNLDSRNSSTVGKRYATRSDTLDFGTTRSNRSVIGAERQNGHPRGGSRDSTHEKPDINEIFKIIDKTRLESEANNRSPTDDISGKILFSKHPFVCFTALFCCLNRVELFGVSIFSMLLNRFKIHLKVWLP